MGIDYKVESTNPTFYSENDPNQFLKYAWRDIEWPAIFTLLDFTITEIDYDSDSNYWSPDDVKGMRDSIQAFCEEDQKELAYLHDDAVKLLKLFNYYVENNASIRAC
jgi:hypothetical protein